MGPEVTSRAGFEHARIQVAGQPNSTEPVTSANRMWRLQPADLGGNYRSEIEVPRNA